jgi:hypothetical protein
MSCGAEIYEGCEEEKRRQKWAIVGFNGEIAHWIKVVALGRVEDTLEWFKVALGRLRLH